MEPVQEIPYIPPAPIPQVQASNPTQSQMYSGLQTSNQWPVSQMEVESNSSMATVLNQVPLGYAGLSALMNMDDDLMLFRRFGSLSVRSLLYLQDEIAQLEEQLKRIEQEQINRKEDTGNRTRDPPYKRELLVKLRSLLKEYADSMCAFSQMRQLQMATKTQRQSLTNWMNAKKPLTDEEMAFVQQQDDLIAINSKEKSILDRFVENSWLLGIFSKEKAFPPEVPKDPYFQFFNESTIARATKWVVIGLGLIFIIVPMLVLQLAIDDNEANLRAGITAGFIGTFMVFMTAFTLARPAEILAATAGYAAVLVVFMTSSNNPIAFDISNMTGNATITSRP